MGGQARFLEKENHGGRQGSSPNESHLEEM